MLSDISRQLSVRHLTQHKLHKYKYRRNQLVLLVCGSVCLWLMLNIFAKFTYKVGSNTTNPNYYAYISEFHSQRNTTIPPGPATDRSIPGSERNIKRILLWTKFHGRSWNMEEGDDAFYRLKCKYKNCLLTSDRSQLSLSDAVVIHARDIHTSRDLPQTRDPHQRWVFFLLESPHHTEVNVSMLNDLFNWTSTYSSDSDVPCPYGRYVNGSSTSTPHTANKSRMVAWFVTNCKTSSRREDYIVELG